jgi:hypothetical protein
VNKSIVIANVNSSQKFVYCKDCDFHKWMNYEGGGAYSCRYHKIIYNKFNGIKESVIDGHLEDNSGGFCPNYQPKKIIEPPTKLHEWLVYSTAFIVFLAIFTIIYYCC